MAGFHQERAKIVNQLHHLGGTVATACDDSELAVRGIVAVPAPTVLLRGRW